MHSNRYTLLFVFIITVVLGTLLSFTKENLKDKQENNLRADVNKTILRSLDFLEEEENPWSNEKVEEIFNNSIMALCVDLEGNKIDNVVLEEIDIERDVKRLPVYLKVVEGELQGIALPVAGKGLWSTLFGYIALGPDLDTVLGIQFYKHGETPGLGGEVEKEWFTNNFVGKKIRNVDGEIIGIKVLKGKVDYSKEDAIHQVDGISGATVTSNGVTVFLKDDLKRYEPYLNKIKENGII
jgi:Na+-transporting NADH:ubiquinone oxidoreductase subunit C